MPHTIMSSRHLGQLFRHFRDTRGLTQQQLADRLWLNVKTIAHREVGKQQMLVGELLRTAGAFDYDVVLQKRRHPGARPTGTGWPA